MNEPSDFDRALDGNLGHIVFGEEKHHGVLPKEPSQKLRPQLETWD